MSRHWRQRAFSESVESAMTDAEREEAHREVSRLFWALGRLTHNLDAESKDMLCKYVAGLHDIIDGDAIGTFAMRMRDAYRRLNPD